MSAHKMNASETSAHETNARETSTRKTPRGTRRTQPTQAGTVRRMLGLIAPYRLRLAAVVIFVILTVVGTLALPVLAGRAVDCALGPGQVDFKELARIAAIMLATIAATSASQWALSAVSNRIAYDAVYDLRSQAFDHLQELPLSYVDSHEHGDLASRIVTDAEQVASGLLMGFQQFPTGILTILVTLAFMFALNVQIAIVVALLTPLSVWGARFISSHSSQHFSGQAHYRGKLTAMAEETIGGISTVETFGMGEELSEQFSELDKKLGDESFRAVFFSSLANPTMRFANSLVYAAIGVFGAFVVISGGITVGGLTTFLGYADQYAKPFNDITGVVTELQNSVACAKRLFALIDEEAQTPEPADAQTLSKVKGNVVLNHIGFSYDGKTPVLADVDLTVAPGQRIALVGKTGCGKTTLMNLLMRFYDVNAGSVCVDGVDVRNLTRASLRTSWGMVLQDTWIRHATVRENIALGKPGATDEEIRAAAKEAYADGFIQRLPDGYNTVLDGNASLSAGQRQLLCIARVMLARPQMLILDEATSNIDTRTELLVQRAFDRLMEGRTSFVVAHRLSTVRDANLICVMEDGVICERGTHEELLRAGGLYTTIYESQFAPSE